MNEGEKEKMEGKVTVRVSELLETAKGCMLREGVP